MTLVSMPDPPPPSTRLRPGRRRIVQVLRLAALAGALLLILALDCEFYRAMAGDSVLRFDGSALCTLVATAGWNLVGCSG
ncbi:hypothetical protein [Comamonas aquatica]|jgi:hypothetical protein|uniref:Uncharacterized protein n=1 Tax=Comamonas aquatica TaxID=225991 RepID=A0AA35GJ64_9BURK|nr:hypothetical protein [Comamonas aquatica]CAB5674740.1 Uncharacterised protein [Comamonas aquatica]CAB5693774.1 Uncharacterised protein [Comamonas aquatica]CAC9200191.1 Uncharacterised protein [Comamonas aquatica]CAC9688886.1 Uncharacterised protein [Comamonas aquatica]